MRRRPRSRRQGKTTQLQLRVSQAQKRAIQAQAERHHMSMTAWVLQRALPSAQSEFAELVTQLASTQQTSHVFAELLDLLARLRPAEFRDAVGELPAVMLSPYWANYLAATVEQAAAQKEVSPPDWTRGIRPLERPVFGSTLRSLRHHLLVSSPPAFSRRNIFVDAGVGRRV